jgi:hypothetical protein
MYLNLVFDFVIFCTTIGLVFMGISNITSFMNQ